MVCPVMTPEELAAVSVDISEPNAQQRLLEVMGKHGVAVVLGVATPAENRKMEEMWQQDLLSLAADSAAAHHPSSVRETYRRVASHGVAEWPRSTLWDDKFSLKRGLLQGTYAWAARLHPNVKKAFSWVNRCEEEDMCVGMDSIFFNPRGSEEPADDRYWMHVDYNQHLLPDRHCYQGFLYTWGADAPEASTTVVWAGSHGEECDLIQAGSPGGHSHFLPHKKVVDAAVRRRLVEGGLKHARRIPVPAGSLLLLSSRTSHQGWDAGRRLAAPICWEDKKHRSRDALLRKLWLAATGLNSNHWASLGRVHSSQQGILTGLSPASDDAKFEAEGQHGVLLPCYPSIFPYSVRPDKMADWQHAMPKLWRGGTAKHCAGSFRDTALLESLLRPEILAAL